MKKTYIILLVTSIKKSHVLRYSPTWEDNIKIDLLQIVCECMDWAELARKVSNNWQYVQVNEHSSFTKVDKFLFKKDFRPHKVNGFYLCSNFF
jgi:hypothetical protein